MEQDEALRAVQAGYNRLKEALGGGPEKVSLEDLADLDPALPVRVTYGLGILRLLDVLRKRPTDFKERLAQGELALRYVKHVEASNLEFLKLGEKASDRVLHDRVMKVREKIAELAKIRAELGGENGDASKEVPSVEAPAQGT